MRGLRALLVGVLALWAASSHAAVRQYHVFATDGFVTMSDGTVKYAFGFNDTGVKGQIQFPSPLVWGEVGDEIHLTMTNVGFAYRPDLEDPHTIHMHGVHVVPYYDGFPESSFAIAMGQSFTYKFMAEAEGTFMWHCHVEAPEHVQMGMYGPLVIYGRRGPGTIYGRPYVREYIWLVSEFDSRWHRSMEPGFVPPEIPAYDQTDPPTEYAEWVRVNYRPDYWLINGLGFPDTIRTATELPLLTLDPYGSGRVAGIQNGITVAQREPGTPNPMPSTMSQSALVDTAVDEDNLVRIIHMGFETHPLHLHGSHFEMIGEDASPRPHVQKNDTKTRDEVFTVLAGSGKTYDTFVRFHREMKCASDALVPKEPDGTEIPPEGAEYTDPTLYDPSPYGSWWYPMHCHDDYHVADQGLYPSGLATLIRVAKPTCADSSEPLSPAPPTPAAPLGAAPPIRDLSR